jgi:ABC-type molybdate transport system ATPase subunit
VAQSEAVIERYDIVRHDVAELRQLATQIVILRHRRVTAIGGVKVLPRGLSR